MVFPSLYNTSFFGLLSPGPLRLPVRIGMPRLAPFLFFAIPDAPWSSPNRPLRFSLFPAPSESSLRPPLCPLTAPPFPTLGLKTAAVFPPLPSPSLPLPRARFPPSSFPFRKPVFAASPQPSSFGPPLFFFTTPMFLSFSPGTWWGPALSFFFAPLKQLPPGHFRQTFSLSHLGWPGRTFFRLPSLQKVFPQLAEETFLFPNRRKRF